MRIKTKLQLPIIAIIIVFTITLFLNFSWQKKAADLNEQEELVREWLFNIFARNQIGNEYFIHREGRSKEQYDLIHKEIEEKLIKMSVTFTNPAEKTSISSLISSQKKLGILFSQLVRYDESTRDHKAMSDELRERSVSHMMVISHSQYLEGVKFLRSIDLKIEDQHHLLSLYSNAIFGLLAALIITFAVILIRGITYPLARLHKGIEIIGSGNLDYKTEIRTKDEIGDLSSAFDRMLDNLKTVTASRDELSSEIERRTQTEEALRESEGRFRGLFEQAAVGVAEIVMETGQFFTVNRRLCELVGRTEKEMLATTFQAITHPEDLDLHKEKTALLLAGKIGHYNLEKRYLRKDGESVWVNIEVSPLWKPGQKPGRNMIVVEDITERKGMEAEMREMSLRDLLTDLYNRRGFITLAEQQIRAVDRTRRAMLLTFIDCDGLKWINDTLGHEEGDKALIDTANVLRQTFRESDIIARLGGDEFAVLSIDAADMNPEDFPKRLQQNIDAGNTKEARPYKLAMSWGMAVYDPGFPLSLDELMSSADERMYAQKKAKQNRRI